MTSPGPLLSYEVRRSLGGLTVRLLLDGVCKIALSGGVALERDVRCLGIGGDDDRLIHGATIGEWNALLSVAADELEDAR